MKNAIIKTLEKYTGTTLAELNARGGYRERDILKNIAAVEYRDENGYKITRIISAAGTACEYCKKYRTFTG